MMAVVACGPVWAAPAVSGTEAPLLRMPPMAPPLQAWDAVVSPTPKGGNTAVRMVLHNPTSETVVITGAQSPMAARVLLNHYVPRDGVTQLYQLPKVEIPPGAELAIVPYGLELRLMDMVRDITHGMDVPLELRFANGTVRTIRLNVESEPSEGGE
jgi:copper(I)-binding protein